MKILCFDLLMSHELDEEFKLKPRASWLAPMIDCGAFI